MTTAFNVSRFARDFLVLVALTSFFVPSSVQAQGDAPKSLNSLIQKLEKELSQRRKDAQGREKAAGGALASESAQLADLRRQLKAAEQLSSQQEAKFAQNEQTLVELDKTLAEKLGSKGELMGVVRQVSGDMLGHVENSLTSIQLSGRSDTLSKLSNIDVLPPIEDLEKLWLIMLQEIAISGTVEKFETDVTDLEGNRSKQAVIRLGAFNIVADGMFLRWRPEIGTLTHLPKQPTDRMLAPLAGLAGAGQGFVGATIDPTAGGVLDMQLQTLTFTERARLGGTIGNIIMILGAIALLLGLIRGLQLALVAMKVRAQKAKPDQPKSDNPLGRVLNAYKEDSNLDFETLEIQLDELIQRESASLIRVVWVVKIVAVVAPLLGLLGTVTGMIQTFQSITLYGTGDPRLMAGGISEALVTTMLGLIVAIPLTLLHSVISNVVSRITDLLEEQSLGLLAKRATSEK